VLRLADQLSDLVGLVDEREVRIEGSPDGMRERTDPGTVTDEAVVLPAFDTLQQYVRDGVKMGLSSPAVRSYLDRLGFDVSAFEPLTREFEAHESLSAADARDLRLAYADRLETDITRARPVEAD
jgi:carboxylate-amine ligase